MPRIIARVVPRLCHSDVMSYRVSWNHLLIAFVEVQISEPDGLELSDARITVSPTENFVGTSYLGTIELLIDFAKSFSELEAPQSEFVIEYNGQSCPT